MKKFGVGLLLFAAMLVLAPSQALAVDTKDYIAAPPGTTLFLTYLTHITGHKLYNDGNKVGDDFNLNVNVQVFRVVQFVDLLGITVDPQLVVPVSDTHLDGATVGGNQMSASGINDPTILATFWAINNPKTKTWLGLTPYLTVPLGDYNKHRVLNPGSNRWANKWEIGLTQGLGQHGYFDLIPSVEFYTDNKDNLGGKLEQDPNFLVESHLSYDLNKRFNLALDYLYAGGGKTKVAGVDQHDGKNNHTLGASFAMGISDHYQLMVQYKKDVSVKSGPALNNFTARFLYIF